MNRKIVLLIAGLGISLCTASYAQSAWDAVADFSLNANPNGAWSYGYGDGSRLLEDTRTVCVEDFGIICWFSSGVGYVTVGSNVTGDPINYHGRFVIATDVLLLEPGVFHIDATPYHVAPAVTWTAPEAGAYSIRGSFQNLDPATSGSVVRILLNHSTALRAKYVGRGKSMRFRFTQTLALGDAVTFVADPNLLASNWVSLKAHIVRLP